MSAALFGKGFSRAAVMGCSPIAFDGVLLGARRTALFSGAAKMNAALFTWAEEKKAAL
jgi:hypothetical protein